MHTTYMYYVLHGIDPLWELELGESCTIFRRDWPRLSRTHVRIEHLPPPKSTRKQVSVEPGGGRASQGGAQLPFSEGGVIRLETPSSSNFSI